MGIQGLLPALEQIQERKHISDYKGLTVAIDSYCWLHKAVYHLNFSLNNQPCKCNKGKSTADARLGNIRHADAANNGKPADTCECRQNTPENRIGDINKLIQYSIKRLNLLLTYNIKPIMIFDGGQLPIKSKTDAKRHK